MIKKNPHLQLVERVGSVLQKDLDNALVAAGARQAQRSVVVVGRGAVHLGAALQQERDGGEVAGPGRLHQRRPPALTLVLQLGPESKYLLKVRSIWTGFSLLNGKWQRELKLS